MDLDSLQAYSGALAKRMGIVLTEAGPERVCASMPVEGNTQPFGLLHGGASAVLAETVGSIHSAIVVGIGFSIVGLDLSCTHHRGVTAGHVHAVSTILSSGRTISSTEIRITGDDGRAVCTSRLTCLIRPLPA
jgi:1,4-dihydroxy-2-naphthoyl-CoA hydrolase